MTKYLPLILFAALSVSAGDGVVVFSKNKFRGTSERFHADDPNLKDNPIGNDNINSVKVPRGCTVILYEHSHFRGRKIRLDHSVSNLNKTRIHNNRVSSLRIEWEQPPVSRPEARQRTPHRTPERQQAGGVTLYQNNRFRGRSEVFYSDIADLRHTRLGNDCVSSLRVAPNYEVVLYEHANFRGCAEVFRGDDPRLKDNPIGNDRVSSIQVRRIDPPRRRGQGHRRQVLLYDGYNYGGRALEVNGEIPNLRHTDLGNDRVSSVEVPPGYQVTLYADTNFRGAAETLHHEDPNLADNWIGDNRVSSVKVTWVGRR